MKTKLKVGQLLEVLKRLNPALAERLQGKENEDVLRKSRASDLVAEGIQPGERAAIRYVSTRDEDRDHEILVPKGCDLSEFKLAPHVLWGHNYSEPPIGSDEWIEADEQGLLAKTRFAQTPRGEEIWTLVRDGHLRTSSVGFVPMEYVERDGPGWTEVTKKLGKTWAVELDHFASVNRIYTKWLLLEHSDVSVPANPNALTVAIGKGLKLSDDLLKQLMVDLPEPDSQPEIPEAPQRKVFLLDVKGTAEARRRRVRAAVDEAIACHVGRLERLDQ